MAGPPWWYGPRRFVLRAEVARCHASRMSNPGDTQPLVPIPSSPSSLAPQRAASRPRSRARSRRVWRWLVSITLAIIVVAGASIVGLMGLIYVQARTDEARPVDAIVVMGAAQYNGRPSPVFEARLTQALALYNAGMAPTIVVTGGKQPGDAYTEAETAAAWLIQRGVPENAIVMENVGASTWDSLEGVPSVLPPGDGTSVLVVSDGFHLFRSEMMLRQLGYQAYSSPAPDSPIEPWSPEEFGHVIRETGGVIVFLPKLLFG